MAAIYPKQTGRTPVRIAYELNLKQEREENDLCRPKQSDPHRHFCAGSR